MMAKAMKTLELNYPIIQFLIMRSMLDMSCFLELLLLIACAVCSIWTWKWTQRVFWMASKQIMMDAVRKTMLSNCQYTFRTGNQQI